jgi:hypothetical protein
LTTTKIRVNSGVKAKSDLVFGVGVVCFEETISVSIRCGIRLRKLHWSDLSSVKQKDWNDRSRIKIKGLIVTSNYLLDS